ncbi:MAG: cysteine desulfurase family protein [Patescibacteria group bacterium]
MKKKNLVYLDYAATTPIDPRVLRTMVKAETDLFANTASAHGSGRQADSVLSDCRARMARLIGALPEEIIFTASATESNNLSLKGLVSANNGKHIIVSMIEHDCILGTAKYLEGLGVKVDYLSVDSNGLVDLDQLKKLINKDTLLVSVMMANNEIGTIEPVAEIGRICHSTGVYFQTDAAQTFGKMPIDVNQMGIDLLTASSHKIYGPKGAGLLYVRKGLKIDPLFHGGGHELGLRSSTVNLPAIVAFVKASEIACRGMEKENKRLIPLRDKLITGVLKTIPNSCLNGDAQKRLANNANFRFDGIEGEALLYMLDGVGIAVSTASACSSPKLQPSHVLLALGLSAEQAHGSLRVSLGRWTKVKEIDYLLSVLPGVVKKLREISPIKLL